MARAIVNVVVNVDIETGIHVLMRSRFDFLMPMFLLKLEEERIIAQIIEEFIKKV